MTLLITRLYSKIIKDQFSGGKVEVICLNFCATIMQKTNSFFYDALKLLA